MQLDKIGRIREESEKIVRLRDALADGMHAAADEIKQDALLSHETVENITEQMRTLAKLQEALIEKIGKETSYADAMRLSTEDFGGFFKITSHDETYREAIAVFGETVLTRGGEFAEGEKTITLLRAIADAVRSDEALEAVKRELRPRLFSLDRGAEVFCGLLEKAYVFEEEPSEDTKTAADAASPLPAPAHRQRAKKEVPADPPIPDERKNEVPMSETAPSENVPDAPSAQAKIFPMCGKIKPNEHFSFKKLKSDFEGLWPQVCYVLKLVAARPLSTLEDVCSLDRFNTSDPSEPLTSDVIADRLEKLYRRGYICKVELEGTVYWMIGRMAMEAFDDERLNRELKALHGNRGGTGSGQRTPFEPFFHPEWIENGVDPEQLLADYIPADIEISADDFFEPEEKRPAEAPIEEQTIEENEAEEAKEDTHVEEEAPAEEEVPAQPAEAPIEEQTTVENEAEEAKEDTHVEEEAPAEEVPAQPAEAPIEEGITEENEAEEAKEDTHVREESPAEQKQITEENARGGADEICARCTQLLDGGISPHDAPDAFLKIAEGLLGQGRGIEAAFFLDSVVGPDLKQKELAPLALLSDQIKFIAHIAGWEPHCSEDRLITVPDVSDAALGKALYYGALLAHLIHFPNYRADGDTNQSIKDDFELFGVEGNGHIAYYEAIGILQNIPWGEGGYGREDLATIVSAEGTLKEYAERGEKLSRQQYKGHHLTKIVNHIFKDEKLHAALDIAASGKTEKSDEVESALAEIVKLPQQGAELDEKVLFHALEDYLDNILWPKVRQLDSIPANNKEKLKDPARGELLEYLAERMRFLLEWISFVRNCRKLRSAEKSKQYPKALEALVKLKAALGQATPAAGVLRFATEHLIAYLQCTPIPGEFDFLLTGNEFFVGKDGLPEEIPAPRNPRLPPLWQCALRQFSQPLPSLEEAFSLIASGAEDERMGNYRTAEALAARLGKEFTPPFREEDLRKRAKQDIADFDSETEKDCLYARIEDLEKEELNAARKELETRDLASPLEYGKLRKGLEDLRRARDQIVEQRGNYFREQIEMHYRQKYSDVPLFNEIERLIKEKNFAVAEEWLARLEEGETEPPAEADYASEPEIGKFLAVSESIFRVAHAPANEREKFSNWAQKEYKNAQFSSICAAEARDIKSFYLAWPFRANAPASDEAIKAFLSECGLDPRQRKGEPKKGDRYTMIRFEMKPTSKTLPSYIHPIREFGTGMNELKVLCYYGAPVSKDAIVQAVNGCMTRGSALIVLIDEAIAPATREEIMSGSRKDAGENPFLLLDQVLAFYLGLFPRESRFKTLLHCTLPYTTYNPFGKDPLAPEMFVVRDTLRRLRRMEEPTPLVYGGRQLGKTALLRRAQEMEDVEEEKAHAVYVSVQPPNGEDAENFFVKRLSEALIEKDLISKHDYQNNQEICAELKKRFQRFTDIKVRLYVDEMDDYFKMIAERDATNLLVPFVDLRREFPNRFKFVFAGLHHVARQPRMLGNNSVVGQLKGVSVGPLSQYEAWSLIQRPFSFLGIGIEPLTVELIATRANFYPGIIQEICQEIVQTIQSAPNGGKPPYHVDDALLQKVCGAKHINQIIPEKINLTLTLDPSYNAIAKLFAHHSFEEPLAGYTPAELLAEAREFANTNGEVAKLAQLSEKELEILLDELVDMSILRPGREEADGGRRFMLRKASFAGIFGTEDSLLDYLLNGEVGK